MNHAEIAKQINDACLIGFDSGRASAFNFVLEYLEEVPSAQGLESLIKKIQQRDKKIQQREGATA